MAAFKYPFNRPSPWTNLLLLAVCNLIPVVGPIVMLGYGIILEKNLVADLRSQPAQFEFNKFTYYLERGVIVFLVGLVLTLAMMPVVFGVEAICFFLIVACHASTTSIVIVVILALASIFLVGPLFSTLAIGVITRASLEGDFSSAFKLAWAVDFFKRVGWTAFGYFLLFTLIAIPLVILSACALCVGMFFAAAYVRLAAWHLQMQLYHLYLDRGGTPLNIKPEPPPPAFPVVMP